MGLKNLCESAVDHLYQSSVAGRSDQDMLAIDYRIKNNNCSTCQVPCHNLERIDLPLLQCDAYNLPWNGIYAQLSKWILC